MTSKYKTSCGKNKIYSVKVWNATRVALCSASNLRAREKRKRTTVQADSQGHVSHYHELMSRVWPVNAYFLLNTIKGGSRETKEQKGTGGGRTGYGKREVVTALSPATINEISFIMSSQNLIPGALYLSSSSRYNVGLPWLKKRKENKTKHEIPQSQSCIQGPI